MGCWWELSVSMADWKLSVMQMVASKSASSRIWAARMLSSLDEPMRAIVRSSSEGSFPASSLERGKRSESGRKFWLYSWGSRTSSRRVPRW